MKYTCIKNYGGPLLSFVMLAAGMILHAADVAFFREKGVELLWYTLAYLPVGLPVWREAWQSIRGKVYFSEFTLMTVATLGAFCIGEYPEGVAVMLFYSIGELFQEKAVDNAKRNIRALLDVRPETAFVFRAGEWMQVSPQAVEVGERIEVEPGGRVPLDGVMENTEASFNTSALTGESVPRRIREGEEVLAGMIVTDRVIRVKVTKPFDKSALSRILEMVQDAAGRKAPAELFIRKFARVYTPVVTGLAFLIVAVPFLYSLFQPGFSFVFADWLYRALVFLVISCPCALVVSIPLGYFGGIGAASRRGILFKGGNYLDAITQLNTVVFDKTGTLTEGVFEVRKVSPAEGFTERQLLEWVAGAESRSTHPVAKAILRYAKHLQIERKEVADLTEMAGYGIKGRLSGGPEILVGNGRFLALNGIVFPKEISDIPETVVCCAVDGRYAGYVLLSDVPKEDARQAIGELKQLDIRKIVILSGDKQALVGKLAGELGVTDYYGDLLPEGKVEQLERLQAVPGNKVAFVGDGINDAPVLALSDVGIAMGGLGSDAAVETADIVIQTDQPSKVPEAIRIGKLTRRIVWQNISMAFGVKLIVLILGAGGLATLWEAVFADVGVALLAIFNAVRIQKMID